LDILSSTEISNTFNTVEYYNAVVCSISKKLNPLSLAQIANLTARSIALKSGDLDASIALLETAPKGSLAADIYIESKLALLKLSSSSKEDNPEVFEGVRKMLLKGKEQLKVSDVGGLVKKERDIAEELRNLGTVSSSTSGSDLALVYGSYYEASMLYRKHVGPPEAFYSDALSYLNYTNIDDIPAEEAFALATDISLAALTGEGVFHFGEVVTALEILKVLDGTPNAWLMELMNCCAEGNVEKFMQVSSQTDVQEKINAQPALTMRADAVKEKITLLALVSMIFELPSHQRAISFEDICERCMLSSTAEVELLIMRALSLNLIRGSIDEVDQTVFVTWVMPRVLDKNQTKALSCGFGEWAVKSAKVRDYMGEQQGLQ